MVVGDFNEVLDPKEISRGNQLRDQGMEEFNDFVDNSCLVDLRYTCIYYSWSIERVSMDDFKRKLNIM